MRWTPDAAQREKPTRPGWAVLLGSSCRVGRAPKGRRPTDSKNGGPRSPAATSTHPTLGQLPRQHLERVAPLRVHAQGRRRLVATVHHAVLAPRVLAVAVLLPRRLFDQVVECLVVLVGDQVARALPAFDVP